MREADKEKLANRRNERLDTLVRFIKGDQAERLDETRKLFGKRVLAVDLHSHSLYSDGCGTVDENYEMAKHVGLDFFFATDHGSIGQKRVVRKWKDASWGQEPGMGAHHVGLLCNPRLFRPKGDNLAADFERAKAAAPFVWIPHPAGWYPRVWYSDEKIDTLWSLGDSFAVEVLNGANKVFRAYDAFDQKALGVWEKLLCDGKRITALGASDAHGPVEIGTTWTGVFAPMRTAESIIKTLNEGRCFASESGLMDFSCDGRPMGATLRKAKGMGLDFRFRVADAGGIASVRLVSQGKVIKELSGGGQTVLEGSVKLRAGARRTYYRLESTASDDLRAFSTPIYVEQK